MSEFITRIEYQRKIIQHINKSIRTSHPLAGLSEGSIDRWHKENSPLITLDILSKIFKLSKSLGFLATKSQQPVTFTTDSKEENRLDGIDQDFLELKTELIKLK